MGKKSQDSLDSIFANLFSLFRNVEKTKTGEKERKKKKQQQHRFRRAARRDDR